jgi:hypothetical protein
LEPLVRQGNSGGFLLSLNVVAIPFLLQGEEGGYPPCQSFLRKFSQENEKTISHITPEALEVHLIFGREIFSDGSTVQRAVILSANPIILPEIFPRYLLKRPESAPAAGKAAR